MIFLHKTILLRLGGRDFQWTQVLGVFLSIITVLMLIKSAAVMFDSWQSVRDFNKCAELSGVNDLDVLTGTDQLLAQLRYADCKDSLFELTGAQVPALQKSMTSRQVATALVEPIAWFFFWAAMFLLGLFFLSSKAIVVPIEEIEHASRPFKKK